MVISRIGAILQKDALQIVPHVYHLNIRVTNTVLIVEDELTLIDTGLPGSSDRIADFVHNLGRSVEEISLIIITHNHIDHAGGLAELRKLTKAKVAAHKADLDNTEAQMPYPRLIRRLLRVPSLSNLHSSFMLKTEEVDIHLEGDEVLRPLGGLEVIHTPGHTPGSISLFSLQNRLLIAGDALTRLGKKPWLPHKSVSSDFTQAIDSIKKLANLEFDTLCFGHGRPLTRDVNAKMQQLIERIRV